MRRAFGQSIAAAAVSGMLQPVTMNTSPAGDDLCALTAVELAARIRAKQVSAREVLTAHLARIERVNPQVNAIVTLVAERAMADATRADEACARRRAWPAPRPAGGAQGSRRYGRASGRRAARRSSATTCRPTMR